MRPPFSPERVVTEFAALLKSYRLASVTGDRSGGEWVSEVFGRHGIAYRLADRRRSELYGAFPPLVNSARLELLDLPRLRAQLLGLERRVSRLIRAYRRRPAWEAFWALAGQGFFAGGSRKGITKYSGYAVSFRQFRRPPPSGWLVFAARDRSRRPRSTVER